MQISRSNSVKILSLLLFFVALYLIGQLLIPKEYLTRAFIQQLFEENFLVSFLIFAHLFALINILYIPGWFMLAGAVFALGKVEGGLVTYLGAIYACSLCFLIIRFTGRGSVQKMKSEWLQKIFDGLDKHPMRNMILLRIIVQTGPILNYALSLSNVRFRDYFLSLIIGLPIPIIFHCVFFETVLNFFSK